MNKTFLLLDNNLLQRVYSRDHGDSIFSTLYSESKVHDVPDMGRQEAVVTPFSLLEAIGFGKVPSVSVLAIDKSDLKMARTLATKILPTRQKIKRLTKENQEDGKSSVNDKTIQTLKENIKEAERDISNLVNSFRITLYKFYLEFFSTERKLSPEYLQAKFQDQYERLSPMGKEAYDKLFKEHIQDKKDSVYIAQFLAWDAIYKFDWPQSLHHHLNLHISADLFRSLKDDIGVMQARGLQSFWRTYSNELICIEGWNRFKMTKPEFKNELAAVSKAVHFKSREDLLDTEILQFLVTGKLHAEDFTPVYVYTMELPEKFIPRIAAMKTLIYSIREALMPSEFRLPDFVPGFILFVSSSGNIDKYVSVSEILPFLADR